MFLPKFVPLTSDRIGFSMTIQLFLFSKTNAFFLEANTLLFFNKEKYFTCSCTVRKVNKMNYKKKTSFVFLFKKSLKKKKKAS